MRRSLEAISPQAHRPSVAPERADAEEAASGHQAQGPRAAAWPTSLSEITRLRVAEGQVCGACAWARCSAQPQGLNPKP